MLLIIYKQSSFVPLLIFLMHWIAWNLTSSSNFVQRSSSWKIPLSSINFVLLWLFSESTEKTYFNPSRTLALFGDLSFMIEFSSWFFKLTLLTFSKAFFIFSIVTFRFSYNEAMISFSSSSEKYPIFKCLSRNLRTSFITIKNSSLTISQIWCPLGFAILQV